MSGLPHFLARHREFITNVATMVSGRATAALVALFTLPIVARLFAPADFGVAASFLAVTGIFSRLSSFRYEMALVLPRDSEEAVTLLRFTYLLHLVFCLSLYLFVAAYQVSSANVAPMNLLGGWIWVLPASIYLAGAIEIQESWLTRYKDFKRASISLVVGNASTSGARIIFGLTTGSSVAGLIWGNLLGMGSRLLMQQRSPHLTARDVLSPVRWRSMREVAIRYSDFPKVNAPAGLVFSLGQNLPVLLLGMMFSPLVAGYYAMAHRLTEAPISIIANSMRKVFLQKAAEIDRRGASLLKGFLLSTAGLAAIGVIPFLVIAFAGQALLVLLLGDRWAIAGQYLEIMAPWIFMVWISSPSNPVFIVLRKQKLWLYLQVVVTALRLATFGVAQFLEAGPEWTLQSFVTTTVFGYIATIVATFSLISMSRR